MASSPAFIATPRIGVASLSTGQSARTVGTTSNVVDVLTGAASGTRILEVQVKATGQPADSTLVLWLHDGTNAHPFREIDLGAPAAGSGTVASYEYTAAFVNLVLPSASWKLQASITATPTSGTVEVFALGGDL